MFGHEHYVAVMRTKPAELRALQGLGSMLRSRITPVLECPPRVLRGCDTVIELEDRLDYIVRHVSGWAGRSVFVDFGTVGSMMPHCVGLMVARTARAGIRPILVVSLKAGAQSAYGRSVQMTLDGCGCGICLRISPEELRCDSVADLIERRLKQYSATPSITNLVIDRGGVDSGSIKYEEFAHLIPWVDAWRTLTVLAGSFPEDLSLLRPRTIHRLQRSEWKQWRGLDSWRLRRPAFGDYAIQHVVFKESVAVPNLSASVRYTLEDEYLVLRGEGVLNEPGPGYGQWNAWAALLVEMPEFFGAGFCAGDQYILERATNWSTSGNAQSWLEAGFSHHLTTAALQVAGQLERVRRITATSSGASWVSTVDIDQPRPTP